jgi:hypothetical protein
MGLGNAQTWPVVVNDWAVRVSLVRNVAEEPVVLRPLNVEPGVTPGSEPKLRSMASPVRPKKLKSAAGAVACNAKMRTAANFDMGIRIIGRVKQAGGLL